MITLTVEIVGVKMISFILMVGMAIPLLFISWGFKRLCDWAEGGEEDVD